MGKLMRAFQGWHEPIPVKTSVYEWTGCGQKHTVYVHASADDGSVVVEKFCNGIRHYLREFSSGDSFATWLQNDSYMRERLTPVNVTKVFNNRI